MRVLWFCLWLFAVQAAKDAPQTPHVDPPGGDFTESTFVSVSVDPSTTLYFAATERANFSVVPPSNWQQAESAVTKILVKTGVWYIHTVASSSPSAAPWLLPDIQTHKFSVAPALTISTTTAAPCGVSLFWDPDLNTCLSCETGTTAPPGAVGRSSCACTTPDLVSDGVGGCILPNLQVSETTVTLARSLEDVASVGALKSEACRQVTTELRVSLSRCSVPRVAAGSLIIVVRLQGAPNGEASAHDAGKQLLTLFQDPRSVLRSAVSVFNSMHSVSLLLTSDQCPFDSTKIKPGKCGCGFVDQETCSEDPVSSPETSAAMAWYWFVFIGVAVVVVITSTGLVAWRYRSQPPISRSRRVSPMQPFFNVPNLDSVPNQRRPPSLQLSAANRDLEGSDTAPEWTTVQAAMLKRMDSELSMGSQVPSCDEPLKAVSPVSRVDREKAVAILLTPPTVPYSGPSSLISPEPVPETSRSGASSNASRDSCPKCPGRIRKARKVPPWKRGEHLGTGSFGSVYLALNQIDGRMTAVKEVPLNCDNEKTTHAFAHEVDVMKRMKHPNIVRYIGTDSDPDNGVFFIFMEYVPGGSLQSVIASFGPLQEPLARHYMRQIIDGVAYLHAHKVRHADIKTGNILVDSSGKVKVADFGAADLLEAKRVDKGKPGAKPKGTTLFMAPEAIRQTPDLGLKADVWSIGCTLCHMITGELPWSEAKFQNGIVAFMTIGNAASTQRRPALVPPAQCPSEMFEFYDLCTSLVVSERASTHALATHPWLMIESDSATFLSESYAVTPLSKSSFRFPEPTPRLETHMEQEDSPMSPVVESFPDPEPESQPHPGVVVQPTVESDASCTNSSNP